MHILNKRIKVSTRGNPDLIDLTAQIQEILKESRLKKGQLTVFVCGSTAAITTFEYEPGLIKDMQNLYQQIVPKEKNYFHDQTWHDANGFSHLRAALQGPSLSIPFENGQLLLGTWQQIVLAEFDNRPRNREIIVQLIGEEK